MKLIPMAQGYLAAAAWAEGEMGGDENGEADDWAASEAPEELQAAANAVCEKFARENAKALEVYYKNTGRNEEYAGHDLWLTRNGHGTGFWDRARYDDVEGKKACDELSEACRKLGEDWETTLEARAAGGVDDDEQDGEETAE